LLALVTLAVRTVLEWKQTRDFELAQREVDGRIVDS